MRVYSVMSSENDRSWLVLANDFDQAFQLVRDKAATQDITLERGEVDIDRILDRIINVADERDVF